VKIIKIRPITYKLSSSNKVLRCVHSGGHYSPVALFYILRASFPRLGYPHTIISNWMCREKEIRALHSRGVFCQDIKCHS